ncbi:zinc transporter ZntB [Alteromonas lipolytica]|uniref:Magnesium transporter CorA n=1 Tax=Alteromonas lipolytica TaxID=1856405 RepID=A0A1E8FCY0_9ALTE|nr:zinc transporter ZntB [Alteromonas lipolytica]OFI33448.1 magnesium transporter CorA [Alteromonas lipolytica]GGF59611.1 zinc transporter ZntB [Alteromonas lipolytica]
MAESHKALLWAYDIKADGSAESLTTSHLTSPVPQGGYRWVHIQSDAPEAPALLHALNLSEDVSDSLMALKTRPRVITISRGALVFLRGINVNPGADPEDMVSLRLWLTDSLIVTARRHERKLMSVQDTRLQIEQGEVPPTTAEMLVALVSRIADRIHDKVEDIDETLGDYEAFETLNKQDRNQLAMLRRQTASIRRYLAPQRDALEALVRLAGLISESLTFDLRDQSDRMTRSIEDLDLARERAIVLQDELRNQIADKQNIRMYVLSMITAIFLPLSFLTGVFGMNVGGLPGTETPNAFAILMTAMGGLAIFMLIAMLWKKWL